MAHDCLRFVCSALRGLPLAATPEAVFHQEGGEELMSRRVAIVAVGQTRHEAFKDDRVYWENDYEAAKLALESAGLDKGQIDTVIASGWDAVAGRTISDMHTCMALGGYLKG